ncbi:unnamed protein product [Moneuplotes crassus]|uniref:Large ribosomal subunit protein uL23 N-terminal domain-containing protein n=2 Tax=Euplotes crassus TaxID=5936 RepID=A0AAD1XVM9_EUPCR|nr:unnamed protein product [Moneuplotes crassus]
MGRPPRAPKRVYKKKATEENKEGDNKAAKAKAVLTRGRFLKGKHKVWTTATFRRPKTLAQARTPKYLRHSTLKAGTVNKYSVIEYPLVGESASKLMEDQNTLVFIVNLKSTKPDIKRTFKERFNVDIRKVNTLIRPDGKKKAFITLKGEQAAVELGSKIGII